MVLPYLLGLFLIVYFGRNLLSQIRSANPKFQAAAIARVTGITLLVLVVASVLADRWPLAIFFAVISVWIMSNSAMRTKLSGWWPNRANVGVSRMRSAMIEMELDKATNQLRGQVLAGEFVGQQLNDLSRAQCMGLYKSAVHMDGGGARLLEAYFDRRFAGWRADGQSKADPRSHNPTGPSAGNMSKDEAYEVLGLRKGAGRDEVVRAHRAMMKKWHPDRGGATDVAARINEAKDMLLRLDH